MSPSQMTKVSTPCVALFFAEIASATAYNSTRLIAEAARAAGIASPLLDLSSELYRDSVDLGNGRLDVVSVLEAIEKRTKR